LEDEHKKKELPGIKMMLLVIIAATPAFPTIPGSSLKRWCLNLPPNSVQNWREMQNKFHQRLYRSEPDFENDDCCGIYKSLVSMSNRILHQLHSRILIDWPFFTNIILIYIVSGEGSMESVDNWTHNPVFNLEWEGRTRLS